MSVLDQTASFEHMYAPGRAKSLFARHRDLTAVCEREKEVLDFEWHIVSNQMDKERNKFKITSAWLWKRMNQLASEPPLIDASEFSDPMPSGRRTTRAVSRVTSSSASRRAKTGVPWRPRSKGTFASGDSLESELPGETVELVRYVPKVSFSYDGHRGAEPVAQPATSRRRSRADERRFFTQKRVEHLKQMCHLEKAILEKRVNQFVDGIEVYKEQYRAATATKSEEEVDPARLATPSANGAGTTGGATEERPRENGAPRNAVRCDVTRPRSGRIDASLRSETEHEVLGSESIGKEKSKAPGGAINVQNERERPQKGARNVSHSASAEVASRQTGENRPSDRPNTSSVQRNRFSLISRQLPGVGAPKARPRKLATGHDQPSNALLGAWELFSADANTQSFEELMLFAAKHRAKKAKAARRDVTSRWVSATTQILLSERAVSAFKFGLEKPNR